IHMKDIFPFYSLVLFSLSFLLTLPLSLSAHEKHNNYYVSLNESISDLSDIITQISRLDNSNESPLHILRKDLEDGAVIVSQGELLEILNYAHELADKQEFQNKKGLINKINDVIEQIMNGKLTSNDNVNIERSHLPLQRINKRIAVLGKALFKSNVIFDKKIRVHERARFYENVRFQNNVAIDGALSVQDLLIEGCIANLCAENLSVVDETVTGSLKL